MAANPYVDVHRLAARNRRRAEGAGVRLGRVGLGLLGLVLAVVLVRPVFLGFLDTGAIALPDAAAALVLRIGLVVFGLAGLDAYETLIRGRDREVLSLLPVDPAAVVRAGLRDLVVRRWWVVVGLIVSLLPVGVEGDWTAFGALAVALVLLQVLAWPAAAVAHLLAVRVARSEAWTPWLDLVRGANPRGQAAFLYAPGVLLLAAGGVLWATSEAVRAVAAGRLAVGAGLLVLPLLALGLHRVALALARTTWFQATAVLSDVDGRWAAVAEAPEERLAVYLEWTVRFLPASWRRFARQDLRHGWRGRRLWITGAWILGVAAAAAGWTEEAEGASRALAVAAMGAALVATAAFVLVRDEPAFLRWWLPAPPVPQVGARAVVISLWAAPVLLLPGVVATYLTGWASGGLVVGGAAVSLLVLVPVALLCARSERVGPWVYGPAALAVVAAVSAAAGVV